MLLFLAGCSPFPCEPDEALTYTGACVALRESDDEVLPDETDGDTDPPDTDVADTDLPDGDADGWPSTTDCDDADPDRHPEATERCNGLDDDCDGWNGVRETDGDGDGDLACADCDDLDAALRASDGSCDAYEFPYGFMSVEDPADFPTLADHGITWVHAYAFGPWPSSPLADDIAFSTAYLDEAEANGLQVLGNLNGTTRAQRDSPIEDFTTFVEAVGAHPALGAWYLADEPEYYVTEDTLFEMQGVLRDETPALPIQVAHCWCTDWWSFWAVGDVRMPDYYGIYNETAPSVNAFYHPTLVSYFLGYYTEDEVQPIQQAFSFAVYSGSDPVAYPPDSRYPEAFELRFWAFSDLAMGVDGLWWWSWYRANELAAGDPWLERTFWPTLDEIRTFAEAVRPVGHPVVVNPGPQEQQDYTYLAYWPRPDGTYVVATNGSVSPRTLDVDLGAAFAGATLVPWDRDSEPVTLDDAGSADVDALPYAVFVWTVAD